MHFGRGSPPPVSLKKSSCSYMEEFITSSPIDVGGSPHVMSVEEMARNNEA
jgi:hypothetical protein